ncbi:MAG: hypothetical protein ABL880_02680 [Methylotenera sp.]
MNLTENNVCLEAFNSLCKELNATNLVKMDECQYWVFERGYKAALEELISNISIAAKSQNKPSLEYKYLAKTIR